MIYTNPYIKHCHSSAFSVLLNNFSKEHDKYQLIHSLIQYPRWQKNIDLLGYVQDLDSLRNNPNTYFVFDASTEGFSPFDNFFFDNLYYSCRINNVDPQKIIFVSANMLDEENIKTFNKNNKIQRSIKVFCFLSFRKAMQDLIQIEFGSKFDHNAALAHFKNRTKKEFDGKYGLSLSRVNREQRTLANYLLYEKDLYPKFSVSQNKINSNEQYSLQKKFDLSENTFSSWCKTLPLTIDSEDFSINHALRLNSHLHTQTLFQIVNETHVDSFKGASLFYSEKTFRSIAHMQPFLIFGQPGCNSRLEDFGFKLYRDLFDYSFDSIQDTKKRYEAILDTLQDAVDTLDKMTREKQIKWRFRQKEILKHNYRLLMDTNLERKKFRRLIKSL